MGGDPALGSYAVPRDDAVARLFGAGASPPARWHSSAAPRQLVHARQALSVRGRWLRIEPFALRRWGQIYVNPDALRVDLDRLPATLFKIVVVHNFRVEDRNPRLDECLAGVFLARRVGSMWERAEDYPVECRALAVVGCLDAVGRRFTPR